MKVKLGLGAFCAIWPGNAVRTGQGICQNSEDVVLKKAWSVNRKITNVHVFQFDTLGCAYKVRGANPLGGQQNPDTGHR